MIKKELSTALSDNLSRLDLAVDAYIEENPDLYAEQLWHPLWKKSRLDFRVELFAQTAWIKVCMTNLNDPAQADLKLQYTDKLLQTIAELQKNIELFSQAEKIPQEVRMLCGQITQQLKNLSGEV